MRSRHLICGLVMLLFSLPGRSLYATELPRQSSFVSELARTAILSVASETTASPQDRQSRLEVFLDKDFDIPAIAKFVLGRYWQKASSADQQDFTAAYRHFMSRVYSQRFAKYNGETFKVIEQRVENPTRTVVYTEMSQPASGQPLRVEWTVMDNDGFRIVDVRIAGVSMSLTQREDFASFLRQNDGKVPALSARLQTMTSGMDGQ